MTEFTAPAETRSARPGHIRLLVEGLPVGQRPGSPASVPDELPAANRPRDGVRERYAIGQRRGLVPSNMPFEAWAALYAGWVQSASATSRA